MNLEMSVSSGSNRRFGEPKERIGKFGFFLRNAKGSEWALNWIHLATGMDDLVSDALTRYREYLLDICILLFPPSTNSMWCLRVYLFQSLPRAHMHSTVSYIPAACYMITPFIISTIMDVNVNVNTSHTP